MSDYKKVIKSILMMVSLIVIISVSYNILTRGQLFSDSDACISFRLYNSMMKSGELYPTSWNGANGEVYSFSATPLAFISFSIFKDKSFARVFASTTLVFITLLGTIWFFKKILKNDGWLIALPLLFVFINGEYTQDIFLYQGSQYTASILCFTLCFGLIYQIAIEKDRKITSIILNGVLLFLMGLEGIRFFAEYIIPITVTLFLAMMAAEGGAICKD